MCDVRTLRPLSSSFKYSCAFNEIKYNSTQNKFTFSVSRSFQLQIYCVCANMCAIADQNMRSFPFDQFVLADFIVSMSMLTSLYIAKTRCHRYMRGKYLMNNYYYLFKPLFKKLILTSENKRNCGL